MHEAEPITSGEPMFAVFDIPASASPDEAARLLNEPYERGWYVHNVIGATTPGSATRVIVKRATRARTSSAATDEAATTSVPATKEARAVQFLRDNREMSAKQLFAAFKALGVTRSEAWITKTRIQVIKADRHITA